VLKNFVIKSKFKTRIQKDIFCNHLKFNLQFLENITKLVLPCWSKKKLKTCDAVSTLKKFLLPLVSNSKPI